MPKKVAVIHCAGSLSDKGLSYCSGVCCTNALKVGDLLREKNPSINVYNIHKDLVFPQIGEYDFFEKQNS